MDLWSLATALAQQVGVSQVSQALHLDYYALKRRLPAMSRPEAEAIDAATRRGGFVELSVPTPARGLRCALESCNAGGVAVRAELTGLTATELATVLRAVMEKTPCCR